MSLFGRLFGGKSKEAEPEIYKGFRIFPSPMKEGGQFRLSARVELDKDGQTLTHNLIRADSFKSVEAANDAAMGKAKQLIDQMGDKLF